MCKIQIPEIPSTATADERRTIMFKALSALNLNDMCEKRGELTYLPWSDCMEVLRSAFTSATYRVIKNSEGLPYFTDPDTGIMVFTEVTIDGVTSEKARRFCSGLVSGAVCVPLDLVLKG